MGPLGPTLTQGATGPEVAELRTRLAELGLTTFEDPPGHFGPATRAAVEAFQHRRGLRVDGVCGTQTWDVLVEAGFRLGDRALSRHSPMLRGDDVAELQRRLGALGFDSGRVDGIFGDLTAAAVIDFQRNVGLSADGSVGPATIGELLRMAGRHPQSELVGDVRSREQLRQAPPTLVGRHVAIAESGGLASTLSAFRRCLVGVGARVTAMHHPDDSIQAREANAGEADVLIALRLERTLTGCATSYYAGYRTESAGGRRLAELIQREVPAALGAPDEGTRGMSLPILRETRMPAVLVEVAPNVLVPERIRPFAVALVRALQAWAASAWE